MNARRTALGGESPAWAQVATAIALAVGATWLAWFRLGPTPRATLWAEDGGVFLGQYLEMGPIRSLWHPYEGYLHLLPRLVVDAAMLVFPIERYAIAVNSASCVIIGLLAAAVFLLSRPIIRNWLIRVVVAAVPAFAALVPHEISGNTANLHWFMLYLAPWVFAYRPRTWRMAAILAALALLIVGTEIQAAIMLPLLALNWREKRVWPVAAVGALGISAQIAATLSAPRTDTTKIDSLTGIAGGYMYQTVGGTWQADIQQIGTAIAAYGWVVVVVPSLALLAVLVLGCLSASQPSARWMIITLTAASVAAWSAAVIMNGQTPAWFSFELANFERTRPLRYGAACSMLLLAALGIAADALITRAGRWRTLVGWLTVTAIVLSGVLNVETTHRRDPGPTWAPQVQEQRAVCRANPDRSVELIALPDRPLFRTQVPCRLILG